MDYKVITEQEGDIEKFYVQKEKRIHWFPCKACYFSKWEYVLAKDSTERREFESFRAAKAYISYQNNPAMKK